MFSILIAVPSIYANEVILSERETRLLGYSSVEEAKSDGFTIQETWLSGFLNEIEYEGCAHSSYYLGDMPALILRVSSDPSCGTRINDQELQGLMIDLAYENDVKGFSNGTFKHPVLDVSVSCHDLSKLNITRFRYEFRFPIGQTRQFYEDVVRDNDGRIDFMKPSTLNGKLYTPNSWLIFAERTVLVPLVVPSDTVLGELDIGFYRDFSKQIDFAIAAFKKANPHSYPSCCVDDYILDEPSSGCR